MLFYAVALFYFELILIMMTTGFGSVMYVLYVALFSVALGEIIEFALSFIKKPLVIRIIKTVFLFINGILFIAIYLTYQEYLMFYNLETMLAGAGGALTEYQHEIKLLIFSVSGITAITLLLLPGILYSVFGLKLKKDKITEFTREKRIAVIGIMCASLFIGQLAIESNVEDNSIYTDQYSFDQAVPRFGLLRSLAMEIVLGAEQIGNNDIEFVMDDNAPFEFTPDDTEIEFTVTEETGSETAENEENTSGDEVVEDGPVDYGVNALNIDFDKLAEAGGEVASLDQYVASLQPSAKNEYTGLFKGKNLIFITAEAFCAEAINEKLTPTLYRMSTKGIQVEDYCQPAGAGTTGGEYQNVFGMLATAGGSSFKNTQTNYNYMTMGNQLKKLGYRGGAFHNGTSTFYDRNLTHVNLGYTDGFIAWGNGYEKMLVEGGVWTSDVSLMQSTLPQYFNKRPFNLYYMSVSGHSPYTGGYARKYWSEVSDLDYSSNLVKGYLSSQMELDKAMEWTIKELETQGLADDTVIVISADHYPYGLNTSSLAELYGRSIDNSFVRDHNRLIIWSGSLEKEEPIVVDTPVESTDILPTLLNLFGVDFDSRLLPGRDIFSDAMPLVYYGNTAWRTDKGTYVNGRFTPNEGVEVPEDYVKEITNIVKNKISYSKGVLRTDYYRHVFEGQEWK